MLVITPGGMVVKTDSHLPGVAPGGTRRAGHAVMIEHAALNALLRDFASRGAYRRSS